jgi:D-beta-D-heptose 7-phosphate kinase/D-beta-D-heptose 1-phosphate adenosyltransferase
MNPLLELIDRWRTKRIVVAGDYMLDHYLYGDADRLSPDAPVPVLRINRQEYSPGGASNVCVDLRALRCDVACIGVTGSDEPGDVLRGKLAAKGCDAAGLIAADDDRPTTVKRSYVGLAQGRHPQKMLRVDFESTEPISAATQAKLMTAVRAALKNADALCIEDYNKGLLSESFCQELIAAARAAKVPVFVDPAAIRNYSRYRGATTITPNRTEAHLATAMPTETPKQLHAVALKLLEELQLEAVVLTLDKSGALLLERGGKPVIVPTEARQVYDVTGAGDMVLAALTGARANGGDWLTSVVLANVAAGLEVERFGVVPIELEEVLLSILHKQHKTLGKVRTVAQLVPELAAHRHAGRKVAFTNGCFDIVHAGHVETLRGARATADLLVLAVNSDASIQKLKGPQRPIVAEAQRLVVLAELECVDYVILFGDGGGGEDDTPAPLLRALRPDVLVKGGTYAHDQVVGWEIVESYGGKVVTIPPVDGLSTTHIVEKIKAGS